VQREAQKSRHRRAALSLVLFVALAIFLLRPDYVVLGIVDQSRTTVSEKIRTRIDEAFSCRHNDDCAGVFDQTAAALSSGIVPSRFRPDVKQKLRLWPVLIAGIERSPPSPLLSGSPISFTPRVFTNPRA
jgi:hypothetical protein